MVSNSEKISAFFGIRSLNWQYWLFAITLVAVMFARALQNMANLVLAVQKQKGAIVKWYGTKTVGYFDIDNMSWLVFYLSYYLCLVFTRWLSKVLSCDRKGETQERAGHSDHAWQSVS